MSGPKFDSPLAERLYDLAYDGLWHDEECSSTGERYTDNPGYAYLFTNIETVVYDLLVHAILREDSQGFVSCETFDSKLEAQEAWEVLRGVYEENEYEQYCDCAECK